MSRRLAAEGLVFGTSDQIIPHRHAAGVPGTVGVHSLQGIGHMPHVEAKDVLARIVTELVRSAE